MKTYIYMLRPTRPEMTKSGLNEKEMAAYQEHVAYLGQLKSTGALVVAGLAAVDGIGIAIINAESDENAAKLAREDPFVTRGVATVTVQPFI